MGQILYGATQTPIHIDDRGLAHLKIVMTAKLRRAESFTYSWHATGHESGVDRRITLWMNPNLELQFHFTEETPPPINRRWLEGLMKAANSAGGLWLEPEPEPVGPLEASPFERR